MAWALDDARWVLGRAKYLDYLVVAAIGGVLVGFIGPKVGWGRWLTYLIGSIFAALIVPMITAFAALPAGETTTSIYNLFQATSDSVVNAYMDIAYPRPAVDHRVPPFHLRLRAARVGDLDVRVLRGVRPSATDECGDRGRRRPRRQHGHHPERRAVVPGPVQPRLAVPADPVARVRRAVGVAAAADRRPVEHLVGLPARRDHLHRRRGRGLGPAHQYGRLRAAGRRLRRLPGQPDRHLARRCRASCRRAVRRGPSA